MDKLTRLILAGGLKLDKRTFEAKTLIERIRYQALNPAKRSNKLDMLRIKDIKVLLAFENLN